LRLQVLNRTLLLLLWCATGESGVDSYISCGYDLIEVIVATLTPRYAVVMFEFTRWPPSGLIGVQSGVVMEARGEHSFGTGGLAFFVPPALSV
jgi:hypothetical protein